MLIFRYENNRIRTWWYWKGTVCKILKNKLKYSYFSSGDFFRKIAKEYNKSAYEFEKFIENKPEIDLKIDQRQKEFGKENNDFIFDSRLGFYFIPDSFKIKFICSEKERVKRLQQRDGGSLEKILENEKKRLKLSKERYKKLYNIENFLDNSNFDLIINTENKTPENISNEI